MRQGTGQMPTKNKFDLVGSANWVISIVGGGIFLFLSWYAMRYTQYMNASTEEICINVKDSMGKNIFFLLLFVGVFALLLFVENRVPEKVQRWVLWGTLTLLCLWIGCFGMWWITTVDRQPVGDQAFIYGGASYFMEGQYSFLNKGAYCSNCPHQLGLIALVELLFHVVGPLNYFAYQVICVEMAVGIALLGYVFVRNITEHMVVAEIYCLTMFACLPLIFYTGWVYGDLPSAFFVMIAADCLLKYHKSERKAWLVGLIVAMLFAVLVRKNSLIVLIALCLVAGVYGICKRDRKLLIALLIAAILPNLAYEGIYKMYEIRSGYEHQDGFPATAYISMGMQEKYGKFGWYTIYCGELHASTDFNTELTSQIAVEDIKERVSEFMASPSYAWYFYREKILSQWNAPLYQSVFYSVQYHEEKMPAYDSTIYWLTNGHLMELLAICDRLQFIIYIGMFCYFVFGVRKNNILQHMLAVSIIGGFFFSILWEAMTRYVFPYYLMMFPLAAIGYWQAISQIQALFGRTQKQKSDDNIIPFERVA